MKSRKRAKAACGFKASHHNEGLDKKMHKPLPSASGAAVVGLILAGLAILPIVVWANDGITGRATVIDGDTIEIRGQRIRLWGIDAPEGKQRCVKDGKLWRAHAELGQCLG